MPSATRTGWTRLLQQPLSRRAGLRAGVGSIAGLLVMVAAACGGGDEDEDEEEDEDD